MSSNGAGYLGVTPPISVEPASDKHKQITESLMLELKKMNQFESAEDARLREVVLSKLNGIIKDFVYRVSKQKKLSETMAREAGGKIFTFGSYRLGVHGPGADIDTLAVAPKHVTRDDFFQVLEPLLKERPEVEEITGVPDAWVPIMTMKFSGVDIDLLFAQLAVPAVPDDLDLRNNDILKNVDEKSQRSLGGSRVTDEILRLVPNVLVFRDALRTIKLWAKRRAIYSNVMGFCGGVAWAMLVARICQLYPNECAGGIISKFFIILQQWNWPTPVLLKPIEEGPLQVRVWNPNIYPADRAHLMPIITPAYPAMCSTHNVSMSTQSIMMKEFKRAADIVDRIVVRSASWSELFEKHDFFSRYRYYLQITASSVDQDVQLKWSGTVESKIRLLVKQLEYVDTLQLAHPFVDGFDRVNYCLTTEESHIVMTGEVPPEIAARAKEDYETKENILKVYTTSFFIGLMVEPKDPNSKVARKLDIAWPTTEFTKLVKAWDRFEQDKMGIVVRHVKASALPAYCRKDGPPVKAGKGGSSKSLKRSKSSQPVTDTQDDTNTTLSPAKRLRASPSSAEVPAPDSVPSNSPQNGANLLPSRTLSGEVPPTGATVSTYAQAADADKSSADRGANQSDGAEQRTQKAPGEASETSLSSSASTNGTHTSSGGALSSSASSSFSLSNGGTQTPTTPQTESAMIGLRNLSTQSNHGTPAPTPIGGNIQSNEENQNGAGMATAKIVEAVGVPPATAQAQTKGASAMPGASLPSAGSLQSAAAAQQQQQTQQ